MEIIVRINPDPYSYTLNPCDDTTDEYFETLLDEVLKKYSGAWKKLA